MATVAPEFAAALERGRDLYNARFIHARRTMRGLDADDFQQFLVVCVEPSVLAAAALGASDAWVDRVTNALYDVALEIVGTNLAGPGGRYPLLSRTWRELFPRIVRLWGDSPRDTIAALTNAAINVAVELGAGSHRWLDRLLDLEPHAHTLDELLSVGQVVAWTCGMAHFRDSALVVLASMPPRLVAALDLDPSAVTARWPSAGPGALRVVGSVGDFVGLGGVFDSPPELLQAGGQLFAFDDRGTWTIHADRFGATLKRHASSRPGAAPTPAAFELTRDGRICHTTAAELAAPAGLLSFAAGAEFAAFTVRHSHRVALVAITAP